ncbi:hypothetical protein [Synoicihabitans lomoniglobus]|uniref:CBM-cenC domain-containing protein n=1 Tax=Synoicihabitans lomoniglobus TaxID=2909285 RepID=A0AAF0CPL5_9BACT|nr:hypothetical protein [Opitutaceae bacterium LMO-M01]WED65374.1 hypothetical protein PXH66_00740 [Opitutaceae bacterium LMO-M01]
MFSLPKTLLLAVVATSLSSISHAQFRDDFDGSEIEGWFPVAGDGTATLEMQPNDGFVRLHVDATPDEYGVWWSFIKRDISAELDLKKLADPAYELRVEARVRSSHAPRRVNFMLNTSRTTDYHEHLREFYINDTTDWHVISFTTTDFDAKPGDEVFVQFCATDFGPNQYDVDVDYYRADVVRRDEAKPDLGEPLHYHPTVPPMNTFKHHLGVSGDSVINTEFPSVNFNDWHVMEKSGPTRVLTISAGQWAVLRWDLSKFKNRKADGAGILELTTQSLALGGKYRAAMGNELGEEFGKVHVIEIMGGDAAWDQETVSYDSLLAGKSYEDVFNTQMIIDLEVAEKPGGKAYFTFPRPVMQRLLDGTTKGVLIRPLGAIAASIYASENASGSGPKLHFNTKP